MGVFHSTASKELPIFAAAGTGDVPELKRLLEQDNADINVRDWSDRTPLWKASENGMLNAVTFLLDADADPNVTDKTGASPLYIACCKGHVAVIEALMNKGAIASVSDKSGYTPLYIAACRGKEKSIEALVKCDPSVAAPVNHYSRTPVEIAAENGHVAALEELLRNGFDANNRSGRPLICATANGHNEIIRILIENKANPNLMEDDHKLPLCIAAEKGLNQTIELLIRLNANPNMISQFYSTPLSVAVQKMRSTTIETLLQNKADPNFFTESPPLLFALRHDLPKIVEQLQEAGADPNAQDQKGNTVLHLAVNDRVANEIVEALVEMGGDPTIQNEAGRSALDTATARGATRLIEILQTGSTNGVSIMTKYAGKS